MNPENNNSFTIFDFAAFRNGASGIISATDNPSGFPKGKKGFDDDGYFNIKFGNGIVTGRKGIPGKATSLKEDEIHTIIKDGVLGAEIKKESKTALQAFKESLDSYKHLEWSKEGEQKLDVLGTATAHAGR